MTTLTEILSKRRPAAIIAATGLATLVLFLVRPSVAYAAGVEEETAFVFNTFSFLIWGALVMCCLLYTSPSPRDGLLSRMPSSA